MNCEHPNTIFIQTPELTHYGKTLCADCGRFLRWEPHPQTIKFLAENGLKLEFLRDQKLSEWEKGFVLSLEKQGRPSPKQQSKLDEICERHNYPIPSAKNG